MSTQALRPRTSRIRMGVAAVEFSITAPLLFLLLYAALELGHANMVFNSVEAACYEGARVGIVPGARANECRNAAQRILDIAKVRGATVTVTPASLNSTTDTVRVSINVPYTQTAIMPPIFTRLVTIRRNCELVREKP